MASTIIVKGENSVAWNSCSLSTTTSFIDVVSKMNDPIVLILSGSISIDIEETLGYNMVSRIISVDQVL